MGERMWPCVCVCVSARTYKENAESSKKDEMNRVVRGDGGEGEEGTVEEV